MSKPKKSHEQKSSLAQRLLSSAFNTSKRDKSRGRSISPFNYDLPKSFVDAVDHARVQAGYDILPRHRHRSASPTARHLITPKLTCSSSTTALHQVPLKKVQFRRTPREQALPVRHPATRPILAPSPRMSFRPMAQPNFMLLSRFRRPMNPMLIRMPQRPLFRFRFM